MQSVNNPLNISLRPVQLKDVPWMYEVHLDPESNQLAGTIPRTREAFESHWATVLENPRITPRIILADETPVGFLSRFLIGEQDHVGYWLDRAYWGQGIASVALRLLLEEVLDRPLHATVATNNLASIRILQKSGFVLEGIEVCSATERFLEREVARYILKAATPRAAELHKLPP